MQTLLQNLLNGIAVGAIYALIALGYTMVYGILKLINFAHGDVFMLGPFVGFYAGGYAARHLQTQGGPLGWGYAGLVMLTAMVVCGLFGFLNERIGYRPLRNAPRIGSMLAAVAGILSGLSNPTINPLMGIMPGLKAFIAAVLGGIGNVPGAVIGGLAIGIIESFVGGSQFSNYKDAIAFIILIAILLF